MTEKQTMELSNQIAELQEQLKNNQTEVQRLTTLLSDLMSKERAAQAAGNNPESLKNVENGKPIAEMKNSSCYIVLKSFRKQLDADQWVDKNNMTEAAIKHNRRKTWFHVVIGQPLAIAEAGKAVYNQRQNGFADAWWKELEYFE